MNLARSDYHIKKEKVIKTSDYSTVLDGKISKTKIRVRYPDTDKMGVVYHGKYLEYLDVARTEFFREAGFTYKELEDAGIGLVVVDVNMKFRQSAFYDEVILVECALEKIESATVFFRYKIFSNDKLLIEASIKLIAADLKIKKAVRIPENIYEGLKDYQVSLGE